LQLKVKLTDNISKLRPRSGHFNVDAVGFRVLISLLSSMCDFQFQNDLSTSSHFTMFLAERKIFLCTRSFVSVPEETPPLKHLIGPFLQLMDQN
jgi:hypothetical protein